MEWHRRKGNIQIRRTTDIRGKEYDEVIVWYPNSFYGREKDYNFDGKENYIYKDAPHCRIHKSCFEHPESCYTIATIEWNGAGDEFHLRTVGLRPWELGKGDAADFLELVKAITYRDKDV